MNIEVEYLDGAGNLSIRNYNISRLALLKHLAIAGQGFSLNPQKFIRTIGMFLHYSQYLQLRALNNDRFSEPPISLADPTEKAQFSNIAGKAIADYLSKRIDNSFFTVNYEAAMRILGMPIRGQRPDLIAFSQNSMFAIEAKGYSRGFGNMTIHKNQAETEVIPVNYSVASVSYNLYHKVRCKYHDPFNQDVSYNNEVLQKLTKNYYSGLEKFIENNFFKTRIITINNEKFYEVELSIKNNNEVDHDLPFRHNWFEEISNSFHLRLILPGNIKEYASKGITNNLKPFLHENINSDGNYIYIDNDRVGLKMLG